MIVYDNVCTPCARKQEWRELLRFARKNKVELTRIDIRRQPKSKNDMWWATDSIPLPVVSYEANGDRVAVNLSEFLRLKTQGGIYDCNRPI